MRAASNDYDGNVNFNAEIEHKCAFKNTCFKCLGSHLIQECKLHGPELSMRNKQLICYKCLQPRECHRDDRCIIGNVLRTFVAAVYYQVGNAARGYELVRKLAPSDNSTDLYAEFIKFSNAHPWKTVSDIKHEGLGVLQGSVLSPALYAIFIDDLAKTLNRACRVSIGHCNYYHSTVHADDIAVFAESKEALQFLL